MANKRYRIFKDRVTGAWQVMWIENRCTVQIGSKQSWHEAMRDVQFLINADRALNRMVNSSFN